MYGISREFNASRAVAKMTSMNSLNYSNSTPRSSTADTKGTRYQEHDLRAVQQNDFETHRVVAMRGKGQEILLVPDNGRFQLPSISIPRWHRVAENLRAAVKSEWGEEVICLLTVDGTSADPQVHQVHYEFCEHLDSLGVPREPTQWVRTSLLSRDLFFVAADYCAVQRFLRACYGGTDGERLGPFARLGWIHDLRQWVEAVIQDGGFHLNGSFRQLNAGPDFSLIRFATDGPAFWFKAVGEPNQREFSITQILAKLFPKYVPEILAIRPDWNGWLTREIDGTSLDEAQECATWKSAAKALAEFQIESIGRGEQILASGAHDLRARSLSDSVEPFMDTMDLLMDQQTKVPPLILSRPELSWLANYIREALRWLTDLEIPDTLGNLDLNPGNVIVARNRCAFVDWAEAYVGNPFFSLQYLLEHFRRLSCTGPGTEAELVQAYVEQYEKVIPRCTIDELLILCPLLSASAYALGAGMWRDQRRLTASAAGYLRSLVRRMKREADYLNDRRGCLSGADGLTHFMLKARRSCTHESKKARCCTTFTFSRRQRRRGDSRP